LIFKLILSSIFAFVKAFDDSYGSAVRG